ncbi:hypothetical protein CQA4T8M7_36920 [Sphaerotilus natans]|jgi:hypothetical protein|nr:hypothetical protein CQA4T8M7_36920 [Sphaerotilus natans]
MRRSIPDADLAQTIAWIWLAFLAIGLAAWLVHRRWRKGHPPPARVTEPSYSQRLQQRLAMRQDAKGPAKRRGRPGKGRRR